MLSYMNTNNSLRLNTKFLKKLRNSESEKAYTFKTIEDMEKHLDEME